MDLHTYHNSPHHAHQHHHPGSMPTAYQSALPPHSYHHGSMSPATIQSHPSHHHHHHHTAGSMSPASHHGMHGYIPRTGSLHGMPRPGSCKSRYLCKCKSLYVWFRSGNLNVTKGKAAGQMSNYILPKYVRKGVYKKCEWKYVHKSALFL